MMRLRAFMFRGSISLASTLLVATLFSTSGFAADSPMLQGKAEGKGQKAEGIYFDSAAVASLACGTLCERASADSSSTLAINGSEDHNSPLFQVTPNHEGRQSPSEQNLPPSQLLASSENLAQQPDPNRERFLQPTPELTPLPEESPETEIDLTPPIQETPGSTEIDQPETVKIPISKIEVIGSTVFSLEQFAPIIKPFEGRSVTLAELQGVADAINQLYLEAGYMTSSAVLVNQQITDGVVQIRVIEGYLSEIQIEGTRRLKTSYIEDRIRLGVTTPLQVETLEDQLRLLRTDPLFENVDASLRSGSQLGESVLIVRVQEAKPFSANFRVDNFSPPSVGSERLGVELSYRNVTGLGDELAGSYYRSTTGGSNLADVSYRVPLNPMNGTLQLRAVIDRHEITESPFEQLEIEGESNLYEISFRQPLIRSPREEFALSLGFSYKDGQTFIFDDIPLPFSSGAESDGVTRTSVFRFGQDYIRRDLRGVWSLRSQFNLGTGLLDATTNPSPVPDSRFLSWLGQAQRVQRLNNDHLLIVSADLQLTPDSLLPSERFVIGGGQSLRGYRQNARAGDNGFRLSVEDRITLQRDEAGVPIFQLGPFLDMGAVWNHPDNPDRLPAQTFLMSAGLGVFWKPLPGLNINVGYGFPFVDLNDRGTNAQDDGLFFSVNYQL